MKKVILFIAFTVLFLGMKAQKTSVSFVPKTVIVKFKKKNLKSFTPSTDTSIGSLQQFITSLNPLSIAKKFPHSKLPSQPNDVDLSSIYTIRYSENFPVDKVVNYLSSFEGVEYAQPDYSQGISLYIPNDTYVPNQWYLDKMGVKLAWDICKGDTNVVIGISDTGVDIYHEEFVNQIKYNWADPVNSIDDDGDGYTDNFYGWDLISNTRTPFATGAENSHGTTVAGFSSAEVDNNKGIAGIGYHCKMLPVRGSSYDAIIYLADHGASIINCSWHDGLFKPMPLFKDIIDYATYNRDALVVCASGNSDNQFTYYPASYEHAMSVTGTTINDEKWTPSNGNSGGGATYGFNVDVSAPSSNIYTTNISNSYMKGGNNGTSFSAPIFSGIAGLVKSHFPKYNALQVGEQVRITADNIDTIEYNKKNGFSKLIGHGRVNAYKALIDTLKPSTRLVNYTLKGLYHEIVRGGDTAVLKGSFVNYLHKAKKITVSISDYNGYFEQVTPCRVIDSLGMMDTLKNFELQFSLKKSIPYDATVAVQLTYDMPNGFHDLQFVTLRANPSYLPLTANGLTSTVSAVGSIGYAFISSKEGEGFKYKNNSILYSGIPSPDNKTIYSGLVLAKDTAKVLLNYGPNSDYTTQDFPDYQNTDSTVSVVCSYNAKYKSGIDFNFKINQRATSWLKDSAFVIYEYDIINTSLQDIDSMRAGLLMDWTISNPFVNKAEVNVLRKYGYVYSMEPNQPYVGIKALRGNDVNQYMIQVYDTTKELVKTTDADLLSRKDVYNSLTHSKTAQTFVKFPADDIIQVIGVKAKNIKMGDTVHVAFALFVASKEQTVSSVVTRAENRFFQAHPELVTSNEQSISQFKIVPNITQSGSVSVIFESAISADVLVSVTDNEGKTISQIHQHVNPGTNAIQVSGMKQSGIYYITVKNNTYSVTEKCIKQ